MLDDQRKIGLLWNDSGTLSVNTVKRFYSEGALSINLIDSEPFIGGLTTGYIELLVDSIGYNGASMLAISKVPALDILQITQSADGEYSLRYALSGVDIVAATFSTIEETFSLRLSFSASSNSISIDGVAVTLSYSVGGATTGLAIPDAFTSIVINRYVGFIYSFVVNNGSSDVVSYTVNEGLETFTDTVNANDAVFDEILWLPDGETVEKTGYNAVPYWTLNRYIIPQLPSPFETNTITDYVSDYTRAYLRYKDSGDPIIISGTEWDGIPITNIERNPDCWYNRKAMTCFSVLTDLGGPAFKVTSLSPRHGLLSTHVRDDYSDVSLFSKNIYYMDMNGSYSAVKIVDYEDIGDDTSIVLFDADISVDIDYATFFTDSDLAAYDYRDVDGCGPSKEGIFSAEYIAQASAIGIPGDDITLDSKYVWSRWNNEAGDVERGGDSSSPCFVYNGDTLYYMFSARGSSNTYPYRSDGEIILNPISKGMSSLKATIETAMDALDLRNGGLQNYNLVEVAI